MKVSLTWLQKYFAEPLPSAEEISDAFTFHAFEIEEAVGDMIDVKVLPDRAAYALSHRGVATELAAILNIPLKSDPLREPLPPFPETAELALTIETKNCFRHMGALVRGVKVGPSPSWLKEALEAVGQRSINNIVDATNYVTLNMGQPLHAFDARKIERDGSKLAVTVRDTVGKESVTTLSGETFELPEGTMVIAEGKTGRALDIAGIKGGMASAITDDTVELFVSVANFDGTSIRKTAQALKLFTDASQRFQNRISPELVGYGMRDILALLQEVAGGEVVGVADIRNGLPQEHLAPVSITRTKLNGILGTSFESSEIVGALERLNLSFTEEGETFIVTPPFERRDIVIPEDLAEEVGRIMGYERVTPTLLPKGLTEVNQLRYRGIERVRDFLIERGFTEISTPSFGTEGEILLANPLQEEKPWLRANLAKNMEEALVRAGNVAPRVLGPVPSVRLFEIGTVFEKDGERLSLALGVRTLGGKKTSILAEALDGLSSLLGLTTSPIGEVAELPLGEVDLEKLGEDYVPRPVALEKYRPFSVYPFALRDVAVWSPKGTEESQVANIILNEAGELLIRLDLFDRFEKEDKVSHAFRLVFESTEKTLADTDIDPIMERITNALNAQPGFTVR